MTELRVAIRYETDMNPLYPKHYATRSLLALVYDTLFRVDHEGKIVPDLAKSITYDVATMTYRIQIDDGKTFHSGKKLQGDRFPLTRFATSRYR
jgi:ABC-type transport system substrate-binding protein